LDDGVALLTDQMVVDVIGEVVHRRAVAKVNVVDNVEALQFIQEPVDGGFMDVGLTAFHICS